MCVTVILCVFHHLVVHVYQCVWRRLTNKINLISSKLKHPCLFFIHATDAPVCNEASSLWPLCGRYTLPYTLLLASFLADSLGWQNKQVYYCSKLFITWASMQKLGWTSKGQITACEFPWCSCLLLFWDLCIGYIRSREHQAHLGPQILIF